MNPKIAESTENLTILGPVVVVVVVVVFIIHNILK